MNYSVVRYVWYVYTYTCLVLYFVLPVWIKLRVCENWSILFLQTKIFQSFCREKSVTEQENLMYITCQITSLYNKPPLCYVLDFLVSYGTIKIIHNIISKTSIAFKDEYFPIRYWPSNLINLTFPTSALCTRNHWYFTYWCIDILAFILYGDILNMELQIVCFYFYFLTFRVILGWDHRPINITST